MASTCKATEVTLPRPIEGSGRYAVKLAGGGCRGWAWLRVDVYAQVPVTSRAVHEGESLEDAVTLVERLVTPGNLPPSLGAGSVATRPLPRGRALLAADVQQSTGGGGGGAVKVVVRSGALAVVTAGRLVPCGGGRTCAVLASGKHVEGQLEDGRLVVEVP
jgi:flagella basal body P-ring formation protein FlgA